MEPKQTRAERLRDAIADDIITGRLSAGTRLDEQSLAERFGVSRTPVREALRQLTAAGFAETRPHRGVAVRALGEPEVVALFEAMAEIEGVCARLAATRMVARERRELELLHQESSAAVRAGDPDSYSRFNWDFHAILFRGARNRPLEEMALSIRARCAPYRRGQFNVARRLEASWREHERIVTAVLRGNAPEAGRAAFEHVVIVQGVAADYVDAARADRPVSLVELL